MSNMVTRCPKCQTSFKVTDEHLRIANGAVRCGACLHVFQARLHWVEPATPPPAPAAATPPLVTPPTPVSQPVAPASPATSAPPAADSPPAKPGKFAFDQSAIDSSSAGHMLETPGERIPETALTRAHQPATPQKKLEELSDTDLISDDLGLEDDEPQITPSTGGGVDLDDMSEDDYSALFDEVSEHSGSDEDFDALLKGEFNDVDELSENAPDESGTGTADEAWAKDLLNELKEEEKPEEIDFSQVEDIRKVLVDFTNPVDVDAARRDLGLPADTGPFASRELTGQKPVPTARAEMIAHIEPAPVELQAPSHHRQTGWKNWLAWNTAALALALALVGQHVFFRFDQLAQQEATRPLLLSLCHVTGCDVPAMQTWRHIRISNLLVRQHPTAPDALAVDAILLNTTSSTLPFPPLELYFNSMEQLPVASRRFAPAEYLAGEMSGKTDIPPGRPVHIAFEIIKPGDEAVNWNLQVARRQ